MRSRILLSIIFLYFSILVSAQPNLEKIIDNSNLVFEGKVVFKETVLKQNIVITINHVLVESVFKGFVGDSIVMIETIGGEFEGHLHFKTHELKLNLEDQGYFFINQIEKNKKRIFLPVYTITSKKGKNTFVFEHQLIDREELKMMIINQTKFINIPFEGNDLLENLSQRYLDTCDIIDIFRDKKTIEFKFDNVHVSNDRESVDFEIMAKSNSAGLKFGKAVIYIKYSSLFGHEVFKNNLVEISKGKILENYSYNVHSIDADENMIRIEINSNAPFLKPYSFDESFNSLFKVKLNVVDINQIANISFGNLSLVGEVYYLCNNRFRPFDNILFGDKIESSNSLKPVSIQYSFGTESLVENNAFYSVDLLVSSLKETEFFEGNIYIDYNTLGFGNNIVSSGKFKFIPELSGSNFEHALSDYDSSTFKLKIHAPINTAGIKLSQNQIKLGTLSFSIENCDEDKMIAFNPKTKTANHIHLLNDALVFPNEKYYPIIANDNLKGKICSRCTPVISSFSPASIHAGNGEILTIIGTDFGDWDEKSCSVLFKNGDDGGFSFMTSGAMDFQWDNEIHWSDTLINIKVPSTDFEEGTDNPACSGFFKVSTKNCGVSDESPTKLNIPWALMNHRTGSFPTSETYKMTLQENSSPGICLKFSDELPGWMRFEFENALNSWCNKTGINFLLDKSAINSNTIGEDGMNLISYGGETENSAAGFVSAGYYYYPPCTINEVGFPFSELDFIIYGPENWVENDEQEKLRITIEHELGHAHMLGHSKNLDYLNQYLMYYEQTSSIYGITGVDSEGANQVFGNSQNIVEGCGIPIGNGLCNQNCNTTETINNYLGDVKIFPNPTARNIMIDLSGITSKDLNEIKFQLYDVSGKSLNCNYKIKDKLCIITLPEEKNVFIVKIINGYSVLVEKIIKL